ncbi:tRNA lysidine(34) synthetase TilS [Microvirga tunisiensis]|uniref:tRNA(Ile)-lysidine synthase n=1 Tax=Pannonibacter tanglangensis TaxID=2750084 RepID=A0A7X5J9R9_9HYPH|nr:tRNA lysidine(34) synthetase TilS [Pannonibacter sp. XCT-53]
MPAAPDPQPARPLEADEADALLAPLAEFRRLALAVSGGPDSSCLLWLAAQWCARRRQAGQPAPEFHVLTVDHGLRAAAREEARHVVAFATRLGVPATVLTWQPPGLRSGVQAAARAARYRLMRDAMSDLGCEALVLGHHRDDQIETFLDRLTRGSGVFGLRAMSLDTPSGPEGLRLLRPLLDVPRLRLEATVRQAGLAVVDDPSNRAPEFKRVRLRRMAGHLASEGLDDDRLLATIRRMAGAAAALDAWATREIVARVVQHPAGPVALDPDGLPGLPEDVRLRLLGRLLRRVGGSETVPRFERLQRLDQRLGEPQPFTATLAGCVVDGAAGRIRIWREPGRRSAAAAAAALAPGARLLWDGRFHVSLADGAAPVRIEPAGHGSDATPAAGRAGFPASAFARAPLLRRADGDAAIVPGFAPLPEGVTVTPLDPSGM